MGRELKRVPLDFDWPLEQLWKGYVNPYDYMDCNACENTGLNPETLKIDKEWYNFENKGWGSYDAWCYHITQEDVQALVDAGRLWDFTRVPLTEEHQEIIKKKLADGGNSWLPFDNGYVPTAEEVNAWNRKGMGHDGINKRVCVKAKAERLGVYGLCKYCEGEGHIFQSEEIKKLHEEWQQFDPPTGEGYQLWSTTTEGHPMSPIFDNLLSLCEWLEPNETVFGYEKTTANEWHKMLDDGQVYHQKGNTVFI